MALVIVGCECPSQPVTGAGGGGAAGGGGETNVGGGGVGGGLSGAGGGGTQDDAGCGLVTCSSTTATCGPIGDGCGALLECGTCSAPQTCGGGGVLSQCGGDGGCVPVTCAQLGAQCGPMSNRCGGLLECGDCALPLTCGGGGIPSRCGHLGTNVTDAGVCIPVTCAAADAGCGVMGDGCGGLTASCGSCTGGLTCGGGGVPFKCGSGQGTCTPKGVTDLQVNCGAVSDGCGTILDAGSGCPAGQTCGGGADGGRPNVCGGPPACVAKNCAQQGANCGVVGDGCGGLTASCGSCTLPDICGGAGVPSVCGAKLPDAGACTNLCQKQEACVGVDGGTTLSGTVVAPTAADAGYGQPDPIPGALVYIPNGTVEPLNPDGGGSCDQCTDGVSGSPLVSTYTNLDGTFTLKNVPCGAEVQVPVVIQLGKWRRQVTVTAPSCCLPNTMTKEQTRLPRKQGEGHVNDNLPRIAVVTGGFDAIECVLPKLGIATDQYSLPSGNGRVKFYKDNGQSFSGGTNGNYGADVLFSNLNEMRKYDMIILDCVGTEYLKTKAQRRNLEAYANAGGRVFSSHYAYVWLFGRASDGSGSNNPGPDTISFTGTANWYTGPRVDPPDQDAFIDTSFEKGVTFGEWVTLVGAQATTSTPSVPRIRINTVRHDVDAVIPPAQRWVYGTPGSGSLPFQYTFNTPVSAASNSQCGRVLFSDFHVVDAVSGGDTWPATCTRLGSGPMTPQEKVFEYLIFDLSSCIKPDVPPPQSCTASTCASLGGLNCGQTGDGCGSALSCGTCTGPSTCGGGGTPNVCGTPACTPRSCVDLGATCGAQGDGCGGVLQCGTCQAPMTCGGGGTPNVCGGAGCIAKTCTEQGYSCGPQGDGCGAVLQCGTCPSGESCGGAGVPGVCGVSTCPALTCNAQGIHCGPAGDGCGNVLQCGTCPTGQTCGGGGIAGTCGAPACTPRTCASTGANCGPMADGCGGSITCGTCGASETCGGGGIPNVCGGIG